MIEIVGFLEGKTPDHRGRILAMLLQQPDHRAEATHDYIQWLFPLDEPSRSVNGAPVLTELDIGEIRQSSLALGNLAKSAGWFLGFLDGNNHWITKRKHNHLRITRVIKSLRLLASDEAANEFRSKVLAAAGDSLNLIDQKARMMAYWKRFLEKTFSPSVSLASLRFPPHRSARLPRTRNT